jgi:glycosyltransferase involved in cell wall biosynthesis
MKLSVIIPVFNEKNTILEILDRVEKVKLDLEKEIIIIDDFSTDGTRELLKELEEKHKIIYQEKNLGKGAAVKKGFLETNGDIIIIQDADLEYDPKEYNKLLEPILKGEAKVVFGSRFLNKHYPRYKLFYFGNKMLSFLFSVLYGQKVSDMETCYKVFIKEVLKGIEIKSNRFNFEPEITAKIIKAGYKIKEIPISYLSRSFSEGKKINWRDGISAIFSLIKYRFFD